MFNKVPPELRIFVTILIIGEQKYTIFFHVHCWRSRQAHENCVAWLLQISLSSVKDDRVNEYSCFSSYKWTHF